MSLWSRTANAFHGERLNREIDEELHAHIEEAIREGRDPAEACRALGSPLRHREGSRDAKLMGWLDAVRADAVFGWRQLLKTKMTSAAAILSLALAMGACTAAFFRTRTIRRTSLPPRRTRLTRLTISICGTVLVGFFALLSSASGEGSSAKYTVQVNNVQQSGAEESDWHKVDAGPFSILAPSGWEFHQLQGVDSYVGEFVGDGVVLTFDFGRYSNTLKKEKKPAYIVTHKSIGGRRAKIVNPRTPGHGIMGVYFRDVGDTAALTLFGHDLTSTQQELVLKIFDTLRFGGPVPRYILPPPPKENVQ